MADDEEAEGVEEEIEEGREEEVEERIQKKKEFMVAIFFFAFGMLLFLTIVAMTTNVYDTNVPGIYSECIEKIQAEPTFKVLERVIGVTATKDLLEEKLNLSATFIRSSIESCGVGHFFNTTSGAPNAPTQSWLVCERGEIYAYSRVCTDKPLLDKVMTMFSTIIGRH